MQACTILDMYSHSIDAKLNSEWYVICAEFTLLGKELRVKKFMRPDVPRIYSMKSTAAS